ncbi:MAG: signal peptide peptidase SppA [Proteobacteria bacterium SG_bin5]|nr:signal peptide peptidase SppA [Sphingomonas sp.]OQW41534.1 MAG: signal peptide peptidase SppA [Proteobacteria bacterium SG_bin5]
MKLVRGAWKLLVGIKDALVLIAMLLFFGGLFAALALRPNPAAIKDGALVIALAGPLVEQPAAANFSFGPGGPRELRLRDVVRAIRAAKDDARVKALVLDLDSFGGSLPAALNEVGDAVATVRKSGKPVLAYATAYSDASYRIAAQASEIWMHPMGGTLFSGPGGSRLYYKGLLDKLGVTVHVYRVGKFKSFIEPYVRADQSPEARENSVALYTALTNDWRQRVGQARPKAQAAAFLDQGTQRVLAAGGDIAAANRAAGLIDRFGDRLAFNARVAEIAGAAPAGKGAAFKRIAYRDFLAAHPLPTGGDAIGVLTVAGDIVDGKADAGTAGGDTIARLLMDGLETKKLKALVVRVDSPGGSALASEVIRGAILRAKAKGLPVVVSMGGVAASGGYWVSTAGDTIFAEPTTITGSIGIFGVVPTLEKSLAKIGITTDGVRTTPLSGQPDLAGGFTPEIDALFQSGIEHGYRQFLERVAKARGKTVAQVDEIAQGRVWDGGTARQIGLVDRFGGLDEAIAEAARRAKLDPAKVHAEYLEKKPDWWAEFFNSFARKNDEDEASGGDAYALITAERRALFFRAVSDARRLATGASVQARCLECAALAPARIDEGDRKLMALIFAKAAL